MRRFVDAIGLAAVSLLIRFAIGGFPLFTVRFEDLFLIRVLDDPSSFRGDYLADVLVPSPYSLYHRIILHLSELIEPFSGPVSLVLAHSMIYLATFVFCVYAFLHLAETLFKRPFIRFAFVLAASLDFAPLMFGSTMGLMSMKLAPNFLALPFQMLALSWFFRNRRPMTVVHLILSMYTHLISGFFLALAMIVLWAPSAWRGLRRSNYLSRWALLTAKAAIGLLPLVIWLSAGRGSEVEILPWQLALNRFQVMGHVSIPLMYEFFPRWTIGSLLQIAALAPWYFLARNTWNVSNRIHRSLALMALGFTIAGITLAELGAIVPLLTNFEPLKSCLWFVQVIMAIFVFLTIDAWRRKAISFRLVSASGLALVVMMIGFKLQGPTAVCLLVFASFGLVRLELLRVESIRILLPLICLVAATLLPVKMDPIPTNPEWRALIAAHRECPGASAGRIAYPPDQFISYIPWANQPAFYSSYLNGIVSLNGELASDQKEIFTLLEIDPGKHETKILNDLFLERWNRLSPAEILKIASRFGISEFVFDRRWTNFETFTPTDGICLSARSENLLLLTVSPQ